MTRFLQAAILAVVASGMLLPTSPIGLSTTYAQFGDRLPLTPSIRATDGDEKAEAAADDAPPPALPEWPAARVIFPQTDVEKEIRAALEKPAEVEFLDTPLEDVAAWIEKTFSINVDLDREALAADGKGGDLPITASGRYSTLHNALCRLLDGQQLTHIVKHDVLLLTTDVAASAPENLSVRLYEVHDLVVMPNDSKALQPDFDTLIDLIVQSVRRQDWQDNGGTIGWIKAFDGPGVLALVARHEERGHREVAAFLQMLREARQQVIFDYQAKLPLPPPPQYGMGHYIQGGMGGQANPPAAAPPAAGAPAISPSPPIAMPPGMLPPSATNPPTNSGGGFF